MQQILKRLELIKTSIAIEDQEIIELQISKLSSMEIDAEVRSIITKLSNNDYGSAIVDIELYINRFSGLVVYEDKEISGLKLELKVLETKLQELSEEKSDYLNEIHEFNVKYNLHLGDIIRKILELKKEILARQIDETADEEKEEILREYEEAKSDYESFHKEYEEIIHEERYDLNEDELLELKKSYRNASKLCHPDTVSDELKEQAVKLFQELNEANSKKDLKKVKEILDKLENGNGFEVASERINDKERLRAKIDELRLKIDALNREIEEIKSDDTFEIIQELDDWNEYFDNLKIQLNEEKERLETEINVIANEKRENDKPSAKTDEDDYWSREF